MESSGDAHPFTGQRALEATQGSPLLVSSKDFLSSTLSNRTLQDPCSSGEDEDFLGGGPLLKVCADGALASSQQGVVSGAGPGRSAQRRAKSSAFPSSLTWDSDSEKDTQDEDELQHFCNPHGLAAHSPGSPTSGYEPERMQEDCLTQEKPKNAVTTKSPCLAPVEEPAVRSQRQGAKRTFPAESELSDFEAPNVSRSKERLPKSKPKGFCRKDVVKEEEQKTEEIPHGLGMDVYTFPGDSDPESPPPAPWAHCTFMERKRRKRALLRPFSGLGSWQRTTPGPTRKSKATASRPKKGGTAAPVGRVFDFKAEEEDAEEAENKEDAEEKDKEVKGGQEKLLKQETTLEAQETHNSSEEIFTCVECSIYFKKQCHLRDHMQEHNQKEGRWGKGTSTRRNRATHLECKECGQVMEDRLALKNHQRLHQESRSRILEEINKLDEEGKSPGEASGHGKSQKPSAFCHQFVCLKCNFSTDIPQELADHAKSHTPRRKAGMQRCSPRLQSKVLPVEMVEGPAGSQSMNIASKLPCEQRSPKESVSPEVCEHLCPTHSSQNCASEIEPPEELTPGIEPDQDQAQVPQALAIDFLDMSPPSRPTTPPQAGPSQEIKTPAAVSRALDTEEGQPQLAKLELAQPDHKVPTPAPKRELAFKMIGRRRSRGRKGNGRPLHSVQTEDCEGDQGHMLEVKDKLDMATPNDPNIYSGPSKVNSKGEEQQQHQEEQEEGEEEGKMPALDDSTPRHAVDMTPSALCDPGSCSPGSPTESRGLLKCKVCGAEFETKRGLSSHARSHLRQHGAGLSESSSGLMQPLDQVTQERSHAGSPSVKSFSQGNTSSCSPSTPGVDQDKEEVSAGEEEEEEEEEDVKPSSMPPAVNPLYSPHAALPSAAASIPPSSLIRSRSRSHSRSRSPSPVVRKAPISSLLPVSSPLRSLDGRSGLVKALPAPPPPPPPPSKPFWAPQEDDAPLNLTMDPDPNKDIVCQLCGAWFETRKGLSSHARAHLRHFGVEYSESKGSPIDLLNRLILTDDFKRRVASLSPSAGIEDLRSLVSLPPSLSPPPTSSAATGSFSTTTSSSSCPSKRPSLPTLPSGSTFLFKTGSPGGGAGLSGKTISSLYGPPSKRPRASPQQVFRLSGGELTTFSQAEPQKDVGCEFCGEYFENRKGLSSHARSHLRQMGITEWSVNGSPIDTLREVITRRGLPCALPLRPLKSPPSSPSRGPARLLLAAPTVSTSPATSSAGAAFLRRLPFPFSHPAGQHSLVIRRAEAPRLASSTSSPSSRAPSSPLPSSPLALLKPKPEPVQLEVTPPATAVEGAGREVGEGMFPHDHLAPTWEESDDNLHPMGMGMDHEPEPTRDIRCEFCGEYFENRKGLSSHARSHLRQMGITEWSVNGSPIDTLREVMRKRQGGASATSSSSSRPPSALTSTSFSFGSNGGVKKEPRPGGSPSWEGRAPQLTHRFSRKPSSFTLLHAGSRLFKHGLDLTLGGASGSPAGGRHFTMVSPQSKRPAGEEGRLTGTLGSPQKSHSLGPQDLSLKGKASPDKHGVGHMDASCELCGFYFENRKALASHARAHLRQFGVTEWSVNGSPIETLSAWMRSRPHKVAEMHRGYMQSSRSGSKKSRSRSMEAVGGQWGSSKSPEGRVGNRGAQHPSSSAPTHGQVARSELNVRLPRGFERRPIKHPSQPDAGERAAGPAKPPRSGTIPALVPKPPSTPLVKVVGKIYSLKCRFCEVEFHGPLSVQEDWIRHLQQHILHLNYSKPVSTTPLQPSTNPDASTSATRTGPDTPTSSASQATPMPATSVSRAALTPCGTPPTAPAPPTPVQTPTSTPTPANTPAPSSPAAATSVATSPPMPSPTPQTPAPPPSHTT